MRYWALLATALALASGCVLIFDGDGGTQPCALDDIPESAPLPQRNPENLECQSFGGPICDSRCGPCPEIAEADIAPSPTWGFCGSPCEQLSESACAAAPECRVIKDLGCTRSGDCATDFLMCLPTDQIVDPAVACRTALDGTTCSRNPACTAFHYREPTGLRDATRILAFAACEPEGSVPGTCYGPVTCDAASPLCGAFAEAEIRNGCYTGRCLPVGACEPVPPPI
jgi:hypothetical protein